MHLFHNASLEEAEPKKNPRSSLKASKGENIWSGRRDLNPRLQPWQGCTLPLSYSRSTKRRFTVEPRFCQALFLKKHIFLFHLFRMPLNMSRLLFLCRERSGGAFFRIRHQNGGAGARPLQCPSWRRQIRLPWVIIEEERAAPYFKGKKGLPHATDTYRFHRRGASVPPKPSGRFPHRCAAPRIPRPATYSRLIRRLRLRNGFSGEDAGSGAGYGRAALGIRSWRLFG